MGGVFAAGAAAHGTACATVFVAALCIMGFQRRQHRRFGRLAGWPGLVTTAVGAAGVGLLAFAVYPLPTSAPDPCVTASGFPAPAALGAAVESGAGVRHAAAAAAALVPAGLLLGYRYRCGVLATVALCALLAAGVEAVQFTGLLGAYPCPFRVAAAGDVLLGAAGGLLGRMLSVGAARLLPRAWPGAAADLLPPGLGRRLLARALDLAVCAGGACAAAAVAASWVPPIAGGGPLTEERVRTAVLAASVLVFAGVVPLLRRDRATPGQAACYVALAGAAWPHPAPRLRVLLRNALLIVPIILLWAAGLGWWIPAAGALHGLPALVRRDQAGLLDLLARTRVRTRCAVVGGLPDELVRFVPSSHEPPPEPAGARPQADNG